jgi:hypothetical protein
MKKLSAWINVEHCSTRVLFGTDPEVVKNRVAFIEKTPRVLINGEWVSGNKGSGQECGRYQPSRDWCDEQLKALGYTWDE